MAFEIGDRWEIMRILEVPFTEEAKIISLLQAVERRSEILVSQIQQKIKLIQEFERAVDEASQGLIKVDVIEWTERRNCSIKNRLYSLKAELARSIGYGEYDIPPLVLFS